MRAFSSRYGVMQGIILKEIIISYLNYYCMRVIVDDDADADTNADA